MARIIIARQESPHLEQDSVAAGHL
jgi:hypothetical protein